MGVGLVQAVIQSDFGAPVLVGVPTSGYVLGFNGTRWVAVAGAAPSGAAGGDLGGTFPSPTVLALHSATSSVNVGLAMAPSSGQVLTATGGTAATWQTPSTTSINPTTSIITIGDGLGAISQVVGPQDRSLQFAAGTTGSATTSLIQLTNCFQVNIETLATYGLQVRSLRYGNQVERTNIAAYDATADAIGTGAGITLGPMLAGVNQSGVNMRAYKHATGGSSPCSTVFSTYSGTYADRLTITTLGAQIASTGLWAWTSTSDPTPAGTVDLGISRLGAASAAIGNGSAGSFSGSLKLTTLLVGTPLITSGSGSPESSVTATVGSIYMRTGGGSGTSAYIKESGSGNTGWTAVASGGGATGWSYSSPALTLTTATDHVGIGTAAADGSKFKVQGDATYHNISMTCGAGGNLSLTADNGGGASVFVDTTAIAITAINDNITLDAGSGVIDTTASTLKVANVFGAASADVYIAANLATSDAQSQVYLRSTGDALMLAKDTHNVILGNATGAAFLTVLTTTGQLAVGSSTAPTVSSGSASPESAVTAPVGSIYLRSGGGASTSFYVKESGSGNTGWVAK